MTSRPIGRFYRRLGKISRVGQRNAIRRGCLQARCEFASLASLDWYQNLTTSSNKRRISVGLSRTRVVGALASSGQLHYYRGRHILNKYRVPTTRLQSIEEGNNVTDSAATWLCSLLRDPTGVPRLLHHSPLTLRNFVSTLRRGRRPPIIKASPPQLV